MSEVHRHDHRTIGRARPGRPDRFGRRRGGRSGQGDQDEPDRSYGDHDGAPRSLRPASIHEPPAADKPGGRSLTPRPTANRNRRRSDTPPKGFSAADRALLQKGGPSPTLIIGSQTPPSFIFLLFRPS